MRRGFLAGVAVTVLLLAAGCRDMGKVAQGRVVNYDAAQGLVTCIEDSNPHNAADPRYDVLPPTTVRIPADPHSMGPAPEAGRLLALDADAGRAVYFDAGGGRLETVAIQVVEKLDRVYSNDARVARQSFPIINPDNKRITIYARRTQQLITFTVPDQYFLLPPETWKLGDEVRYYYKTPDQALRMMNVTRTEIS